MKVRRSLPLILVLTCLSGSALAFELGTCILLQTSQSDETSAADELVIRVNKAVLLKKGNQAAQTTDRETTALEAFTFSAEDSTGFGTNFDTSTFKLPDEATASKESSLFDLSTNDSSLDDN